MKINILTTLAGLLMVSSVYGQGKYFTRTGEITFYSETPVENIKGVNNQASCIFDTDKGEMALFVLMKGFEFEKALMQDHFNENYVESDKFPKATFKGKILNYKGLDLKSSDPQELEVEGDLNVHGVTRHIKTTATVQPKGGKLIGHANFPIKIGDFDIKIPKAVINNINEEVQVTVNLELEPYNM